MDIQGNGAPSKSTVGAIGDQYTDSLTGTVYECAYIINTKKYNDTDVEYIWKKVIEEDKDSGSGSEGSTQMQVDWNQNDETAADYVKGRTHWIESLNIEFDGDITDKVTVGRQEYTTLVKVSEYIDISGVIQMYMEVTDSEGGISNVTIDFPDPANVIVTSFDGGIRVNEIYFVKETGTFNVDGSEYTFPETGVYFNYVTKPVVYWDSLVSLRTVHQLDEKFLPDSVKGMIVVVEDNSESSTGYSANKTYQEILDKVSAGENVYAVYNDMVTHLSAITGLISHMEGISTLVVQNTVAIFRSIDGLYEIVIADDGTVKVNRYSEYATVDDVNELIATALGTNLEELESLVGGGEADE